MVGVVKADVVPNGPDSYFWPGAYGWSLGDDAQLYKGGVLKAVPGSLGKNCRNRVIRLR